MSKLQKEPLQKCMRGYRGNWSRFPWDPRAHFGLHWCSRCLDSCS